MNKGDYSSASKELRNLWNELREAMPKYGFGRSELMPIRSNKEGVGRYIGKYIAKHVGAREQRDKGVRLFSSSSGFRPANTNYAWNTPYAWVWRMKVKEFARLNNVGSYGGLQMRLGKSWAFKYAEFIFSMELPQDTIYPTAEHWCAYNELPEKYSPLGWVKGMTSFKVVDGIARKCTYSRSIAEYSSPEHTPRKVLKLPEEQSELQLTGK